MNQDEIEAIPFRTPELPVDNGAVELLERPLEDARAGRIIAFCGVSMNARREFGEFVTPSVREHVIPFMAYTRVLQMRLERDVEM